MMSDAADEFNVYTQEAGPGKLTVNIDGPSKAKIDVVDRRTGFVTVSYVVEKEGQHHEEYLSLRRVHIAHLISSHLC